MCLITDFLLCAKTDISARREHYEKKERKRDMENHTASGSDFQGQEQMGRDVMIVDEEKGSHAANDEKTWKY